MYENGTYKKDLKELFEELDDALETSRAAFWDSQPNSHERAVMCYVRPMIQKLRGIVEDELNGTSTIK